MFKLLALFIGIAGGLWWFARSGRVRSSDRGGRSRSDPARLAPKMLRCEYCNVHFPESEAVNAEKHVFCCAEHRAAAGY
jgi:hypothetical protein